MNRTATTPIGAPRTIRRQEIRNLTSLPAGKSVPIAAVPLFREDAIRMGQMRFSFEMMETVEILMNAVHVDLKAYLVPKLAFDRFDGMDAINRSYTGEPYPAEGGTVIPWFETEPFGTPDENDLYYYMGMHAPATQEVNTDYLEAYNQIQNFRRANRSADLPQRDRLDRTLAEAFWKHTKFGHIVPDFDQAMIDGEVPLNVTAGALPVRGLGVGNQNFNDAGIQAYETGKDAASTFAQSRSTGTPGYDGILITEEDPNNPGFPAIFAEMEENGITVSLSNIDLARKTAAFARMRERYAGHSDEFIIDLLMDNISIPEQNWKQPMLIGEASTIFGMSKRYATNSGSLTESVVSGGTFLDLTMNTPRIPMGGIVMVICEITPEQLFERQKDHYFFASDVEELPSYLRDELDPEKVAVVENEHIDTDHDTGKDTFGYAPLNYQWDTAAPKIGGRFRRPEVDAPFDEDRQRIWAVETQNPTLTQDFYLCTTMHTKPFENQEMDPFEIVSVGEIYIGGNTVFGPTLYEMQENYKKVFEKAPIDRIDKTATAENQGDIGGSST